MADLAAPYRGQATVRGMTYLSIHRRDARATDCAVIGTIAKRLAAALGSSPRGFPSYDARFKKIGSPRLLA